MRSYYEQYSVEWDCVKIEEQIRDLTNFDILLNGEIVGALAFAECERLAVELGVNRLKLRVFKISPAFRLYERVGFVVDSSDDRFYNMSKKFF
ncbi:GNAT family N-acetyltransferase [Vibrio sp. ED004]|nr:GNAT family N-acetyltransferase [Vibrio sp. ED004]UPR58397.1 GNAT family N-acetyltransferase [Vibrio sp. ED004]